MGIEADILSSSRTVAVVGISAREDRPSFIVARYLQEHGYTIIPVNPTIEGKVLGQTVYPDLASVPVRVDVVDIFRKAEEVMPIVEDAIRIGAGAVWMQEGIVNEEAASRARSAGLRVVMDRCMKKEHARLHPQSSPSSPLNKGG